MIPKLMNENWILPLSWLGAKRHKTSLGDRKNLSRHLPEHIAALKDPEHYFEVKAVLPGPVFTAEEVKEWAEKNVTEKNNENTTEA